METICKVISWTLVFALLSMLQQSLAKHVAAPLVSTYSCQCQVQVYDSPAVSKDTENVDYSDQQKQKLLATYDFGKIADYPTDDSHDCHRARELCRNSCQDRAVLTKRINHQGDLPPTNHEILGYHLCHLTGMITRDKSRPFRVDLQASVDQCPGKKAIKQRHTHLCCVITPLKWSGKSFNVQAWDEFCDASKLHV